MKSLLPASLVAAAIVLAGSASASVIGLPGSGSVSTTWDTFPSASFTGDAPDTAATTFNSTLDFSTSPASAILTGGGQRLYTNENSSLFTVSGTATVPITDLQIVLKFTTGVNAAQTAFNVNLNGTTVGLQGFLGTVTESPNTFNVYEWTWSGLSIPAGGAFSITAAGLPDHVSIDAVQVNTVPEASSAALGLLAMGGLLARRRRA